MKIEIQGQDFVNTAKVIILPLTKNDLENSVSHIRGLFEALKEQEFDGESNKSLVLNSFAGYKKIVLIGLGDPNTLTDNEIMKAGGRSFNFIKDVSSVVFDISFLKEEELIKKYIFNLVTGFRLKSWNFNKYFTTKHKQKEELEVLNIISKQINVSELIKHSNAIVEGVFLTRNLITEPANKIYSDTFAAEMESLTNFGLEVQILNEKELEKIGMRSLLSVNQASSHEAKVGILKWNGASKNEGPLAFVGKGVTFDSGGLSIKPANAMMDMKTDMSGAATVVGLLKTLAMRKAKVNAIGVVGLVENVISSKATRPGDVVKSLSGKTIEILNTDAEGRLVLADILYYTQDTFKPKIMIDLATLTGAIIIALGKSRAGLFSNDKKLIEELLESGEKSGEKLWNMPVTDEYKEYMKSDIADIANISLNMPGAAGSTTAAIFLKEFIKDAKWAHLDIAGMARSSTVSDLGPKGASGFGIMLLDTLISSYYERK